ncbi:hypothetical protein CAPTEDRAFT_70816, partial [Capitella teleta]
MLMTVSWCFLFLNLPSCIYFIGVGEQTWPTETLQDLLNNHIAYDIVNLLYYINNAINFFLYCLTGTKFRRVLLGILTR